MPKLIDLTGKNYGRLTVLERDYETQKIKNSKEPFWKCQCECGNIVSKRGHDLKQNKIISCGCLKKENTAKINYISLVGQTFGKLTVLEEAQKKIDKHIAWKCQCECGNIVTISGRQLRDGTTQSCGCIKSQGELKIIKLLNELKINYETQKCFENCKNILPLKFDFYLPDFNILIEYNGIQHYQPIEYMGGKVRFEQQLKTDQIKKEWAQANNIKLIIISYLEYKSLSKDYLLKIIKGE